eukprot:TRINITY_DN11580_c0_g1_i1.p1 TRINITY_DN11580_c0_g1~~TRINITY_DN11580_c0_g1_i1.p1  ORF type:complete len:899 (+),score=152.47 TRINITY_DN11580_c0_g1_i1:77-2698(+)
MHSGMQQFGWPGQLSGGWGLPFPSPEATTQPHTPLGNQPLQQLGSWPHVSEPMQSLQQLPQQRVAVTAVGHPPGGCVPQVWQPFPGFRPPPPPPAPTPPGGGGDRHGFGGSCFSGCTGLHPAPSAGPPVDGCGGRSSCHSAASAAAPAATASTALVATPEPLPSGATCAAGRGETSFEHGLPPPPPPEQDPSIQQATSPPPPPESAPPVAVVMVTPEANAPPPEPTPEPLNAAQASSSGRSTDAMSSGALSASPRTATTLSVSVPTMPVGAASGGPESASCPEVTVAFPERPAVRGDDAFAETATENRMENGSTSKACAAKVCAGETAKEVVSEVTKDVAPVKEEKTRNRERSRSVKASTNYERRTKESRSGSREKTKSDRKRSASSTRRKRSKSSKRRSSSKRSQSKNIREASVRRKSWDASSRHSRSEGRGKSCGKDVTVDGRAGGSKADRSRERDFRSRERNSRDRRSRDQRSRDRDGNRERNHVRKSSRDRERAREKDREKDKEKYKDKQRERDRREKDRERDKERRSSRDRERRSHSGKRKTDRSRPRGRRSRSRGRRSSDDKDTSTKLSASEMDDAASRVAAMVAAKRQQAGTNQIPGTIPGQAAAAAGMALGLPPGHDRNNLGLPPGMPMGMMRIQSSAPAGDMRSGDWICSLCSAHNFASKFTCFRCFQGVKPDKGLGQQTSPSTQDATRQPLLAQQQQQQHHHHQQQQLMLPMYPGQLSPTPMQFPLIGVPGGLVPHVGNTNQLPPLVPPSQHFVRQTLQHQPFGAATGPMMGVSPAFPAMQFQPSQQLGVGAGPIMAGVGHMLPPPQHLDAQQLGRPCGGGFPQHSSQQHQAAGLGRPCGGGFPQHPSQQHQASGLLQQFRPL